MKPELLLTERLKRLASSTDMTTELRETLYQAAVRIERLEDQLAEKDDLIEDYKDGLKQAILGLKDLD